MTRIKIRILKGLCLFVMRLHIEGGVVKKCWRACATPAIRKRFENLCLQSLALTKMSFNDFPLRYDSMGGSWNISFRCVWFWIRCHFPISIFLRLGKAGWYCVTKGNIFFNIFFIYSLSQEWPANNYYSHHAHSKQVEKVIKHPRAILL